MPGNGSFFDVILEHMPFSGKAEEIAFQSHGVLTLGVEVELQLIDPASYGLVSKAENVLKAGSGIKMLKPEIYQSMVEINTSKCNDVFEIERDLLTAYQGLNAISRTEGVEFAATGCHPFAKYADNLLTQSKRYHELIDRNQWITRRITIFSMHVHLGMKSGDDFVRFNNFFLHFLPHLLALSASSPFWQGEDTGLAACRPCIFEALPTAGQPYQVQSWHEFEHLYQVLKRCRSIRSLKDLWWDIRPSPAYGTLEIRICDGPATLSEGMAIVAYIHLLAHWFSDNGSWIERVPTPSRWMARENKWRVMRHGLEADLVTNVMGETRPIRQDIEEWLQKLTPLAEKMNYGRHLHTLRAIMANGNSAERQRAVFASTGSLASVVKYNIAEFEHGSPLWEEEKLQQAEQQVV